MDNRTLHRIVRELIAAGEDKSVYVLLRRYCAGDRKFVDEVALRYIAEGNKHVSVLRITDYLRALSVLHMGASEKVCRRLLQEFVAIGAFRQANDLAKNNLKRNLNEYEVRELVNRYTADMGKRSATDEEWLTALAGEAGDRNLLEWAQSEIDAFRKRWDEQPDC